MKYLKNFKVFENIEDQSPNILKNAKLGGKPTMVLRINEESFNLIKDLFDNNGKGIIEDLSIISDGEYKWTFYIGKNYHSDKKDYPYMIWGVSGDYSFGDAPSYLPRKYFGNVKVANKLFNEFINRNLYLNIFHKINKGGFKPE